MTPDEREVLAQACQRAADTLYEDCRKCAEVATTCPRCFADFAAAKLLLLHARALRAGRVTITEEATNGGA